MNDHRLSTTWQQIRQYDQNRPGFAGEHVLVLAAGLATWMLTRKSPSFLGRTAGLAAATALVGRAASGRDGVAKLLAYLPVGGGLRR